MRPAPLGDSSSPLGTWGAKQAMLFGDAWEPGLSPGLTAVSPQPQVPSDMGPSWGVLLLAVALGVTAAACCPAPCVCDNLCAHVLCLNGSLTAIPDTIPEVGKGNKGRGMGREDRYGYVG